MIISRRTATGLGIGVVTVATLLGPTAPALAAPPETAPSAPSAGVGAAPAAGTRSGETAQLRRLVTRLGHEAHGRVQVTPDAANREVTALVETRSGAFEISAGLTDDPDGVAAGAEACRSEAGGLDGRVCRPVVEGRYFGAWDRTYPAQPGRRSLTAAGTTRSGGTLFVIISNLAETDEGKVIGPDWQQAGITVGDVWRAMAVTRLTAR